MSENVLAYGYMVVLAEKVDHEERDEKAADSGLTLNYEGTIVFKDISSRDDVYGGMFIIDLQKVQEFVDEVEAAGFVIDDTTVKAFTSPWYNGSDSYMSDFTVADFHKAIT